MLSTAAMNQICRAMLDRLTLDSGPARTSRGIGPVLSSEMLSLVDTQSVPFSLSGKGQKFRKLGYDTMVTLSCVRDHTPVVSLPPGSLEFVQTLLQEKLGIRMRATTIKAKIYDALLSESDAAAREGAAVDAGNGVLLGLLDVALDRGAFGAPDFGILCNDEKLAEVIARIAELYSKTAIGAPSMELNSDNRSAFGLGFHGQALSALLKVGAEHGLALFNAVNLACIDLSHAENPLEAFRITASVVLMNAPKFDGDFDSVSLNGTDSTVAKGGKEWGKCSMSGPKKTHHFYSHPRTNASSKRNAELEAHIKPFLGALKGLCQCAEKTLGGDDWANKCATKYVPWFVNILTSKAEFDKRDYCVLLELRMIKNKMKLLSSPNYDFSSAEDDQPVEQRPAQIARREASTDVSDESRAALFEDARTTSMWNVVSPLIMPFLGHFEWGTDN